MRRLDLRAVAAAAAVALGILATGIAWARGTLIDPTSTLSGSTSSGGASLAIGSPITGGTATRVLFEGPGGTLADSPTFSTTDNSQLRQFIVGGAASQVVQARVTNTSSDSWAQSSVVALNNAGSFAGFWVNSSNTTGDWNGVSYANLPMVYLYAPTAGDAVVLTRTGGALRFWFDSGSGPSSQRESLRVSRNNAYVLGDLYAGSEGLDRWLHVDGNGYLVAVDGKATSFHKGGCVLNGGSPSSCSMSIENVPYGSTPRCTCSVQGVTAAAAAAGCATQVLGSTVQATSADGATYSVAVVCW